MPTLHLQTAAGRNVGTAEADPDDVTLGVIDEAFRTVVVDVRDDGSVDCRECEAARECKHENWVEETLEDVRESAATE